MTSAAAGLDGSRSFGADRLLVGAALLASLMLLWFVTHDPLVVAGFGGGLISLGVLACTIALRRAPQQDAAVALPD